MTYIYDIYISSQGKAILMLILPAPNDPYGRPRNPGTFQIGVTEISHFIKTLFFRALGVKQPKVRSWDPI